MNPPPSPFRPDELFEHAAFLRGLARGLLANEGAAEDVVQDTWVAALERPPRSGASLRSWLATVARRLALNRRRGEGRRAAREGACARDESAEASAESVERIDVARKLLELVSDLREPYRATLVLRYYEGLTPGAIAARQGVPVKTVKTRLARALQELRERMDERSSGDRRGWMAALAPLAPDRMSIWPAAAGALAGGGIVKQVLLVVAAVVVALVVWRSARPAPPAYPEAAALVAEADARDAVVDAARPSSLDESAVATRQETAVAVVVPPSSPGARGDLEVHLRWESDGTPARGVWLDARWLDDPAPRAERVSAATDASGVARFASLLVGPVMLFLDRGVRYDAEVRSSETTVLELDIPAGTDVAGRVVDPAGEPVANAEIWVEGFHQPWSRSLARSLADGTFEVRALGEDARLGARARGCLPSALYAPADLPVDARGRRSVDLVLGGPGGWVAGRVLDPAGEAVASAVIKIGERGGWQIDLPSGLRAEVAGPVPVQTDERGEFEYPGALPIGAQPVHAAASGFPVWSGVAEIREGERSWTEIRLDAGASIVGRVLDAAGEPVSGAHVLLPEEGPGAINIWIYDFFPPPRTTSDFGGRFRLDWIPPGERTIHAYSDDAGRGRASSEVLCRGGETIQCDLVLDLGATIRGRVVDREGRPLARWGVYAEPIRGYAGARRTVRTDETGTFVLANLDEGDDDIPGLPRGLFRVSVAAPGEIPIPPRAEVERVKAGVADLEIRVANTETAAARLRGVLLESSGRPPQDVDLTLWLSDGNSGLFVDLDRVTGEFEYGPVIPERYVLEVSRNGRSVLRTEDFELRSGEIHDVGTLVLEVGASLVVRIEGIPEEVRPALRPELHRAHQTSCDLLWTGEEFRARDVPPGAWTLSLRNPPGPWFVADREVEITTGEEHVLELDAQPGFECELVVGGLRDIEGAWQEAFLDVRDEAGTRLVREGPWLARHEAGEKAFSTRGLLLPRGRFLVEAWTDGGHRAQEWIVVDEASLGSPRAPLVLR